MNSARELLSELQSLGVELTAQGSRLHVKAPIGIVTPEIRHRLTTCKPELVALLTGPRRAKVWYFSVDGRGITAIDHEQLTEDDFRALLDRKFGANRVERLQLLNHHEYTKR